MEWRKGTQYPGTVDDILFMAKDKYCIGHYSAFRKRYVDDHTDTEYLSDDVKKWIPLIEIDDQCVTEYSIIDINSIPRNKIIFGKIFILDDIIKTKESDDEDESEGCEFCENHSYDDSILYDMTYHDDGSYTYDPIKMKFCPICGKPLKDY